MSYLHIYWKIGLTMTKQSIPTSLYLGNVIDCETSFETQEDKPQLQG